MAGDDEAGAGALPRRRPLSGADRRADRTPPIDRQLSPEETWPQAEGARRARAQRQGGPGALAGIGWPGIHRPRSCGRAWRRYSTVRHWLKRLGLETQTIRRRRADREARANGVYGVQRVCPKHGKTTFVSRPEGGFRCGTCRMEAVRRWRRRVKERLVLRAGGTCEICGYDRYYGALQFHHLDPKAKEFSISRNGTTRAYAEVCAEAEKCALLCANCHAEVEAGLVHLAARHAPLRLRAT